MAACQSQNSKLHQNKNHPIIVSSMAGSSRKRLLCLFDVDGTMTKPRQQITAEMRSFMENKVIPRVTVGLVGGSDRVKILEQMQGEEAVAKYDFCFSENGLVAYQGSRLLG